jgi:hypothetical protein
LYTWANNHIPTLSKAFIAKLGWNNMLSKELTSSYEEYKADTDFVADWLATTAKHHGFSLGATAANGPKPAKLTGRDRTLARRAGTLKASNANPPLVYRIGIDDFVPLAQYIAKRSKPRVQVPAVFGYHLRRAIRRPKDHSQWHNATGTTAASDGHGYFIGVLEKVLETLMSSIIANHGRASDNEDKAGKTPPRRRTVQ